MTPRMPQDRRTEGHRCRRRRPAPEIPGDDDPRIAPMLKAFEQKFLASAERLGQLV